MSFFKGLLYEIENYQNEICKSESKEFRSSEQTKGEYMSNISVELSEGYMIVESVKNPPVEVVCHGIGHDRYAFKVLVSKSAKYKSEDVILTLGNIYRFRFKYDDTIYLVIGEDDVVAKITGEESNNEVKFV